MIILPQRKAISSAIGAVLVVVGLALGAGVGYFYSTSTAAPGMTHTVTIGGTTVTTTTGGVAGPVTYTIGSVEPITGTYASYGLSFQNSVNLAVRQMNANLSGIGSNIKFAVVSADDAGTPAGALSAVQSEFQSSGIQVVIGPLTSGEVQGVVQFATQNHIVVLPGAATATSLQGTSQYLFRPGQPGDQFEGAIIGNSVVQSGGKNVVYLYRDDTSEYGTFNISSKIMLAAGLRVTGVSLAPNQADYVTQVQAAGNALSSYLSSGGTTSNTVVVLGDGGTEAQNIFSHAATDPNLGKVRWFGIESLSGDSKLLTAAGTFMSQVGLTVASPSFLSSPQTIYFNSTYTATYGQPPTPFSNYFYDNAWIAMLSVLAAGSYDGAKISAVLPLVANHFYGSSSTGIWLLNHDQSIAQYDVLKCETVSGTTSFVKVGSYNGATGVLTLS